MVFNSFSKIITSSFSANVVVLVSALLVFLSLRRKDTERQVSSFITMIIVLLARELIIAIIPIVKLNYIFDIVYFCVIFFVYTETFGRLRILLIIAPVAINGLVGLLYIAGFFVDTISQSNTFNFIFLFDVVVIALYGILSSRQKSSLVNHLIRRSFIFTVIFLLIYVVFSLTLGYKNELFLHIIKPVSYLWILLTGLVGFDLHDEESVSAISYYENSIDSLYNLFFNFSTTLKQTFSTEDVLACLNNVMISETGASGGVIYLVNEFEDIIETKAYAGQFPPPFPLPEALPKKQKRVETYMKHAQFNLGETILGEVAKTGKDVFSSDVSKDDRFVSNGDDSFLRFDSFMAVPLMVEEKIIGVAAVSKKGSKFFTESDFDKMKLLANFGTLAVSSFFSFLQANEKSGIEQSADIAAEIQRTIIPKKLSQFPNLSMAAFTTPAHGISGDYYDIIRPKKNIVIGVVGDVAGRGVSAALIMVMIRSILHLIANTNKDISTILNWVNHGITGKIEMDHYATLGLVSIDMDTGIVEYSNAAHQPLLVYRARKDTIETIDLKSVPIGVERTSEYQKQIIKLENNDIIALYTDGIVEAMNDQGKQFGRKSLGHTIAKFKDLEPKDIVSKLKDELASFTESTRQHDDQTVLVFKMKL